MAVQETIFQHWIFTKFALPFFLIFFIVFAILEKTKIFGDGKKQLNALISLIIGLIFISATSWTLVVSNLILFLTISLIVVFVGLLLWGFLTGGDAKISGKGLKIVGGIVVVIAVILAILWASNTSIGIFDFLFGQSWSKGFWTNFLFIVVIGIALALVLLSSKPKS